MGCSFSNDDKYVRRTLYRQILNCLISKQDQCLDSYCLYYRFSITGSAVDKNGNIRKAALVRSKMDVARESLKTLLTHLRPQDKLRPFFSSSTYSSCLLTSIMRLVVSDLALSPFSLQHMSFTPSPRGRIRIAKRYGKPVIPPGCYSLQFNNSCFSQCPSMFLIN